MSSQAPFGLDAFEKNPLGELAIKLQGLVRHHLWAQVLIAMVAGAGVGLALSPSGLALTSEQHARTIAGWLALPGHVFLALIQMVVVALVTTSIILGVSSTGDPAQLRRIGLRIAPYFMLTTVAAVSIGASLALVVRPGRFVDSALVQKTLAGAKGSVVPTSPDVQEVSLPERIVAVIPSNPLGAALENSMLQVVVFAILIGIALVAIDSKRAKPLIDLSRSLQEVSMEVVSWAMVLAPFAVFGLLAQITMQVGVDAILGISVYVGTVLGGLLLLLVLYVLIAWFLAGRPPWRFLSQIRGVQLLAFSTSSSAAVMPLSIKTADEKLKVRSSVSQLVVPLGATINMDGTALYQVVAAVFLTQVFGVELTLGGLVLLTATTVGASIGSPSAPGVGIVILATVLQGIGVPTAGVALIIGVDRILDMSRTAVNVTGDLTACVVMDRWLGGADSGLPGDGAQSVREPAA